MISNSTSVTSTIFLTSLQESSELTLRKHNSTSCRYITWCWVYRPLETLSSPLISIVKCCLKPWTISWWNSMKDSTQRNEHNSTNYVEVNVSFASRNLILFRFDLSRIFSYFPVCRREQYFFDNEKQHLRFIWICDFAFFWIFRIIRFFWFFDDAVFVELISVFFSCQRNFTANILTLWIYLFLIVYHAHEIGRKGCCEQQKLQHNICACSF
jgi:hypothetical protein